MWKQGPWERHLTRMERRSFEEAGGMPEDPEGIWMRGTFIRECQEREADEEESKEWISKGE